MENNTQLLVSGAVVFKDARGKRLWLIVRQGNHDEEKWEIPKVIVRKGESSVRASIRMMGEMAGMNARVLEEAGRGTGAAVINGKSVPQKFFYYLMVQKSAGEVLGFLEYKWLEFGPALKKLSLKREKDMLRGAKQVLKTWEKTHRPKSY